MAKAKASAMALAVPCAEATAFAPLPGWQLEPATRASVLAMAKATAFASASALACTAATQQTSVSQVSQLPLWHWRSMKVAEQDSLPRPTLRKPYPETQTNAHVPRGCAIPVQLLRRPRILGTLQTPHRQPPGLPPLLQTGLTRTLSQQRCRQLDAGWRQLHQRHKTSAQQPGTLTP